MSISTISSLSSFSAAETGPMNSSTRALQARNSSMDNPITADWYLSCSPSGYSTRALTRVPWVCRVKMMASTLTQVL